MTNNTTNISIRMDSEVKKQADRLFEENRLIKPNTTDKRFYVKAYARTFEK